MAIKLTINSHKGGVTKSTSISNVAGALSNVYPNSKILIVDTDGQANISTAFGMNTGDLEYSMYDVFMGNSNPEDLVMPIPALNGRIDLLPAANSMDFLDFDFMEINDETNKLRIFRILQNNKSLYDALPNMTEEEFVTTLSEILSIRKHVIEKLHKRSSALEKGEEADSLTKEESEFVYDDIIDSNTDYFNMLDGKFNVLDDMYDFILFDTPPEIKAITSSVLAIVDEVIIPFEPEALSVEGVIHLLKRIGSIKLDYNPNLHIAGILPVKVDMRTNLHKEVLGLMREYAENNNVPFFETVIPSSIKFATATALGIPATLADKRKRDFSSRYYDLVDELIADGRLPKIQK